MKAKAPKGIYRKFARHMRENAITALSLKDVTNISTTQLSFILKGERPLTEENRQKLNSALKTDY